MPCIVRGRLPDGADMFGWLVEALCRECHAYRMYLILPPPLLQEINRL
jgi:hypothetical protein